MEHKKMNFTKWVCFGWWGSFAFFMIQSFLISCLCLTATPWLSLLLFGGATILTFASQFDKTYRFSPYSAMIRMFKKNKK